MEVELDDDGLETGKVNDEVKKLLDLRHDGEPGEEGGVRRCTRDTVVSAEVQLQVR